MGPSTEVAFGTEGYSPRSSGLLRGGGQKRYHYRCRYKGARLPDIKLTDPSRIKREVPDFDPDRDYNRRELALLAEKILLEDPKDVHEHPMILTAPMLRHRMKHEIYVKDGIPDPAHVEGLYWRTHPQGRKWASEEMRRATGCGFYEGIQETDREAVPRPAPRPPAQRRVRSECSFEGCGRQVINVTHQLCQHHYWMHHTGQELRPIGGTRRYTEEEREVVRESWDTGESHAEVARRFGMSAQYVRKLRDQGQIRAVGKIRFGGA